MRCRALNPLPIKIYLDFNSGITAIVGPNGSEKVISLTLYAGLWESKALNRCAEAKWKTLYFQEPKSEKALGFAEVTLTLDNSSGIFDIDFPELQVTRRIYRSGESEYYINKTTCRLKGYS